jgi:hypothetical protein
VPTWNHLWFIVYLWVYTLVLGLLLLLPSSSRTRSAELAGRALSGPLIIVVPLALLYLRMAIHWPGRRNARSRQRPACPRGLSRLFLFGFLLARSDQVWTAIRRWWRVAAVLGGRRLCGRGVLNILYLRACAGTSGDP